MRNTKQNNLYDPVEPGTLTDFDDVSKDNKFHIFHALGLESRPELRSVVMSYTRETGYGAELVMNNAGLYFRAWNPDKSEWKNLCHGIYTYNYSNDTFDFNNTDYAPGIYRLGAPENMLNAPVSQAAYGNVLVIRHPDADTLAMILFPYYSSTPNSPYIMCKSTRTSSWASVSWFKIEGIPI